MPYRHPIMVVFGTRPEAIKLAPVIAALRASPTLRPCVCVTGQHREMLDQMLGFFDIRPDHDLQVMRPNQDLGELTARLLQALRPVLAAERPDALLVQGDTTTTFAASLAAYYQRIPTGHVEAGLRTGDPYNPFPEEINRRLTTQIAAWHFAPTERARRNLLAEGVAPERVVVTGNTIVDALQDTVARLDGRGRQLRSGVGDVAQHDVVPANAGTQASLDLIPASAGMTASRAAGRRLILVTGHRRESFGDGLRNICAALREIAERHADVVIVYPVHLNPSVRGPVHETLGDHPRIVLTEPLDYLPFVDLMRRAYLILTDSGGVQEEAPSLRVPVLVMRETTERPEGVDAGVAQVVGTRRAGIVAAVERLLADRTAYDRMVTASNPYGDGTAAHAIVHHLERTVGVCPESPLPDGRGRG